MSPDPSGTRRHGADRLPKVVLPGPEGLVLARHPRGGFSWTAEGAAVGEEIVKQRAASRMRECEEAIELCDVWLGQGAEARSAAERDEILDSRFRYGLERKLLGEFLDWTGGGRAR